MCAILRRKKSSLKITRLSGSFSALAGIKQWLNIRIWKTVKNIVASKYKLYLPSEKKLKKELERELIEIEKKLGD